MTGIYPDGIELDPEEHKHEDASGDLQGLTLMSSMVINCVRCWSHLKNLFRYKGGGLFRANSTCHRRLSILLFRK